MSWSLQAWDVRYPGVLDGLGILGGGANVIMQLSWPAVGYGVKESRVTSGSILHHPVKRLRTTITYLAAPSALAAAAAAGPLQPLCHGGLFATQPARADAFCLGCA